ncbi:MAG: VOC family protein [Brevibacterium sp.]|nr:VOC family protein [Brevibacterium sp.]
MKLDAISIITADMPAAVQFYSSLCLDLVDGGADAPHTEFSSGSLRLLLDTAQGMLSIDPEWTRPTGGHRMSLTFDCSTAEAVDSTFAQLTAGGAGADPVAGVVHEPWDAFWGQRYAVISDPDDNQVDLFAALGSPAQQ